MEKKLKPIKIIEYRSIYVPIFYDNVGKQYFTILDDEEIGFGSYNENAISDIKYFIDRKLDLIYEFPDFAGAKLEWFTNGFKHRDIRLIYNYRIIKVFLVHKEDEITEISKNKMISESNKILKSIYSLL